MRYDIIGDIHGYADKLKALLVRLGYRERGGTWQHPDASRRAVFVGDYIDRGPQQVETVRIVRGMVEVGSALAIMGNHELNAIGYMTPHPDRAGEFLRLRTPENRRQHSDFLNQVGEGSALHLECIEWFRTLPFCLDLGEIRVVHAWWNASMVEYARSVTEPGVRHDDALIIAIHDRASEAAQAIKPITKGLEADLPDGWSFLDEDKVERNSIRVRWWDRGVTHFHNAAMGPDRMIANVPVALELPADLPLGLDSPVPVFIGHYWMQGEPAPLHDRLVCVDYAAAVPHRPLVAYCWDGETVLSRDRFVKSH